MKYCLILKLSINHSGDVVVTKSTEANFILISLFKKVEQTCVK